MAAITWIGFLLSVEYRAGTLASIPTYRVVVGQDTVLVENIAGIHQR